jgi:hypothetical protein
VLSHVSRALTTTSTIDDTEDILSTPEARDAVAGVSVAFVEAARRGFDGGDVASTLERDAGTSKSNARTVAAAYEKIRAELEQGLRRHARSSSVKRLKSHACRADYVVSTSANGDSREPAFHLSWVLGDGSGEDERVNFKCNAEEMMHLVETLREACAASETFATR